MDLEQREQMQEDIRQFLIESVENLATLAVEIVELEKTPADKKLVSSVFRTIHTIKGTCGFFGFDHLSATAHIAENILCQVRAEQRKLTPELISLILEAVDKIKALLANIEASGTEGDVECAELIARMEVAHLACDTSAVKASPAKPVAAAPKPTDEPAVPAPSLVVPTLVATAAPKPAVKPAEPEIERKAVAHARFHDSRRRRPAG